MPLRRFILPALSSGLIAGLMSPAAMAQSASDDNAGSIALGGSILANPRYAGADETRFLPLPYVDLYNYKGFDFIPFELTYPVIDYTSGDGLWAWGLKAGPQAELEFGRREDLADELEGLGDLNTSLYLGGFSRLRLGPVGLRVEGGQDVIDGTAGAKIDATLGSRIPVGKGTVTLGYSLNWGDDDYVQSFFGVTNDQALGSVFTPFDLSGGVYANTASILVQQPIKNDWEITALTSYRRYVDDVADSPILTAETGSADGLTVLFGLSKRFHFNNR